MLAEGLEFRQMHFHGALLEGATRIPHYSAWWNSPPFWCQEMKGHALAFFPCCHGSWEPVHSLSDVSTIVLLKSCLIRKATLQTSLSSNYTCIVGVFFVTGAYTGAFICLLSHNVHIFFVSRKCSHCKYMIFNFIILKLVKTIKMARTTTWNFISNTI